jgi:hypothetical protein
MKTQKNKKLIEMTREEYDTYMVSKYPKLFNQRNLPMTETCMCWGFDIGKGWYDTLDDLCNKIQTLCDVYPIYIEFTQIKEKYGSGRFYFDSWHDENVSEEQLPNILSVLKIIDDLISKAEDEVNYICAETGERYYDKYSDGGWIYDISPEALIKINPDRYKKNVESFLEKKDLVESIKYTLMSYSIEKIKKVKEFVIGVNK